MDRTALAYTFMGVGLMAVSIALIAIGARWIDDGRMAGWIQMSAGVGCGAVGLSLLEAGLSA